MNSSDKVRAKLKAEREAQRRNERAEQRKRELRQQQQAEQRRADQREQQAAAQQRDQWLTQQRAAQQQQQQAEQRQQQQAEQRQAQLRDQRLAQQRQQQQAEQRRADQHEQQAAEQQRDQRLTQQRAAQQQLRQAEQSQQQQAEQQRRANAGQQRADQREERRQQRSQDEIAQQRAAALREQEAERRNEERRALDLGKEKRVATRTATTSEVQSENLLWLSTQGRYVVDENGKAVNLRGINVIGLDSAAPTSSQTLPDAVALDADNLSIVAGLWGANLVRLPFHGRSILAGNGFLSGDELLAGLDEVVDTLAQAGMYTLLALQAEVAGASGLLPDADTFRCWQLLANRYQSAPGVLYEIYASAAPLPDEWPAIAGVLVGAIRKENPASLLFMSSAGNGTGLAGLPLRFATGDPVHNMVYTLNVSTQHTLVGEDTELQAFTNSYPVFVTEWTYSEFDLGRSSELLAGLFERYGMGWVAANWNADPRLVRDAIKHDFTATRFGLIARRALAQPVKPQYLSFAPSSSY